MNTVCAVLSTDDNHRVTQGRKAFRLLLPRECRKTYCIRNFCICTSFFYELATFGKITACLCSLDNNCYGFCPVALIFLKPQPQFCRIFKNGMLSAPAAYCLYLRVFFHPDDNDKSALSRCPADNCMYCLDFRAGSISNNSASINKLLIFFFGDSVGADYDILSALSLTGA